MTTYWQTWAAAGLAAAPGQRDQARAEFSIDRGLIFSFEPRKRLARNREREVDGKTLFFRRYPYGPLAAHVVGYSTVGRSRTGLERSLNDYLTASNANLSTALDKALDELRGKPVQGNNVVTTLDLDAQEVAHEQLGTNCGAVVALDPRTGKVLVMASSPSFDPNLVEEDFGRIAAHHGRLHARRAARSTARARGSYVPGLDVQGDHRVRRARVEEVHARVDVLRPRLLHGLRQAGEQLRHVAPVRHDRPHERARLLGQLGLLQHRPEARREGDPRHREALRLLRAAAARDAGRRAARRAASTATAGSSTRRSTPTSTRAGWRSARSGCSSRRCRWRWSRARSASAGGSWSRRSSTGSSRPGGKVVERAAAAAHPPGGQQARRRDAVAAMMRLAVERGHRHGRADPRLLGRRQDGHRRDGRPGLEHDVVHRLRGQGRGHARRSSRSRSSSRTRAARAARRQRRSPARSCRQSCRARRIPNL